MGEKNFRLLEKEKVGLGLGSGSGLGSRLCLSCVLTSYVCCSTGVVSTL